MSTLASDHQQQQSSMSTLASRAEAPVMLMVAVCGDRAQELARPQLYLGDQ